VAPKGRKEIRRKTTTNGNVSFWYAEDWLPAPRPALAGDLEVDVAIVGAGYAGLWSAYYLAKADPALRIAVLEARFAGFGASGRNGGWLANTITGGRDGYVKSHGRALVGGLPANAQRHHRRGRRRCSPRGHPGLGFAGGYVGTGAAATNLAGRTLSDLVQGRDTKATSMPWVNRGVRRWEPEPLRWIAVQAIYGACHRADAQENTGRRTTSPLAPLADKVAGRQ
jgi:glycine/D-amino acid oxidase-like deaminating enzyme